MIFSIMLGVLYVYHFSYGFYSEFVLFRLFATSFYRQRFAVVEDYFCGVTVVFGT